MVIPNWMLGKIQLVLQELQSPAYDMCEREGENISEEGMASLGIKLVELFSDPKSYNQLNWIVGDLKNLWNTGKDVTVSVKEGKNA